MSRLFWDTNLFIYLIEDYGQLSERVAVLAKRMRTRGDQLYTSTFTLGEVLVKPCELGDESLRRRFGDILSRRTILVPFSQEPARIYAGIRKDRSIKAPDAIQLACAAYERVDLFVTNDDHLGQKTVPGINFITSLSSAVQLL